MSKRIKRKEFEKIFATINAGVKNIWVIHRVKELSSEIIDIALRLSALDFINYVRITDEILAASNELKGLRIKEPVTTMNHPTAIGIEILYYLNYKTINFNEINSPVKGNGSKMVSAILTDLPNDWKVAVMMDWSDGFWDKMKEKHKDIEWLM